MAENVTRNIWDALYEVKAQPFAEDDAAKIVLTLPAVARGTPTCLPVTDGIRPGAATANTKVDANDNAAATKGSGTPKSTGPEEKASPLFMPSLCNLRNKLNLIIKSTKTDKSDSHIVTAAGDGNRCHLGLKSAPADAIINKTAAVSTARVDTCSLASSAKPGDKQPLNHSGVSQLRGCALGARNHQGAVNTDSAKVGEGTSVVKSPPVDRGSSSVDSCVDATLVTPTKCAPQKAGTAVSGRQSVSCNSSGGGSSGGSSGGGKDSTNSSPRNMFKAFARMTDFPGGGSELPLDLSRSAAASQCTPAAVPAEPDNEPPQDDNATFDGGTVLPLDLSVRKAPVIAATTTTVTTGATTASCVLAPALRGVLPSATCGGDPDRGCGGGNFGRGPVVAPYANGASNVAAPTMGGQFRSFNAPQEPKHVRQVSPVRPHIRCRPPDTAGVGKVDSFLLSSKSTSAKNDVARRRAMASRGLKLSPGPSPSPSPSPDQSTRSPFTISDSLTMAMTSSGSSPALLASSPSDAFIAHSASPGATVLNVPRYESRVVRGHADRKKQEPLQVSVGDSGLSCRRNLPVAQVPPNNTAGIAPARTPYGSAVKTARSPRSPSKKKRLSPAPPLASASPPLPSPYLLREMLKDSGAGTPPEPSAVQGTPAVSAPALPPQSSPTLGTTAPSLGPSSPPSIPDTASLVSPPRINRFPGADIHPRRLSSQADDTRQSLAGVQPKDGSNISDSDFSTDSSPDKHAKLNGIAPLSPLDKDIKTVGGTTRGSESSMGAARCLDMDGDKAGVTTSGSSHPSSDHPNTTASQREAPSSDGNRQVAGEETPRSTDGPDKRTLELFLQAEPHVHSKSANSTSLVESLKTTTTTTTTQCESNSNSSSQNANSSGKKTAASCTVRSDDAVTLGEVKTGLQGSVDYDGEISMREAVVRPDRESSKPKGGFNFSPFYPTSSFSLESLESSRQSFYDPIAFAYEPRMKRVCKSDIRQSRYYKCHVTGKEELGGIGGTGSADFSRSETLMEEKSVVREKPVAFKPTGNWREDLKKYKKAKWRLPEVLIHEAGLTKPDFLVKPLKLKLKLKKSEEKRVCPPSDTENDVKKRRKKRPRSQAGDSAKDTKEEKMVVRRSASMEQKQTEEKKKKLFRVELVVLSSEDAITAASAVVEYSNTMQARDFYCPPPCLDVDSPHTGEECGDGLAKPPSDVSSDWTGSARETHKAEPEIECNVDVTSDWKPRLVTDGIQREPATSHRPPKNRIGFARLNKKNKKAKFRDGLNISSLRSPIRLKIKSGVVSVMEAKSKSRVRVRASHKRTSESHSGSNAKEVTPHAVNQPLENPNQLSCVEEVLVNYEKSMLAKTPKLEDDVQSTSKEKVRDTDRSPKDMSPGVSRRQRQVAAHRLCGEQPQDQGNVDVSKPASKTKPPSIFQSTRKECYQDGLSTPSTSRGTDSSTPIRLKIKSGCVSIIGAETRTEKDQTEDEISSSTDVPERKSPMLKKIKSLSCVEEVLLNYQMSRSKLTSMSAETESSAKCTAGNVPINTADTKPSCGDGSSRNQSTVSCATNSERRPIVPRVNSQPSMHAGSVYPGNENSQDNYELSKPFSVSNTTRYGVCAYEDWDKASGVSAGLKSQQTRGLSERISPGRTVVVSSEDEQDFMTNAKASCSKSESPVFLINGVSTEIAGKPRTGLKVSPKHVAAKPSAGVGPRRSLAGDFSRDDSKPAGDSPPPGTAITSTPKKSSPVRGVTSLKVQSPNNSPIRISPSSAEIGSMSRSSKNSPIRVLKHGTKSNSNSPSPKRSPGRSARRSLKLRQELESSANLDNSSCSDVTSSLDRSHKGRRKKRSMLDELANTDGYVAEKRLKKDYDSLYEDPAKLGREERALQRAIIQFCEMEMKQTVRKEKSAMKAANKRAKQLKRRAIHGSPRKAAFKRGTFVDYEAEILETRTRSEASAFKRGTFVDYEAEILETRTRSEASGMCSMNRKVQRRKQTAEKTKISGQNSRDFPTRVDGDCDREDGNAVAHPAGKPMDAAERKKRFSYFKNHRQGQHRRGLGVARGSRRGQLAGEGGSQSSPKFGSGKALGSRPRLGYNGCLTGADSPSKILLPDDLGPETLPPPVVEIVRDDDLDLDPEVFSLPQGSRQDSALSFRSNPGQDDDTASLASSSNPDSFPFHIPPEIRRFNVCRDTGENIMHKAARNGHYDIIEWCCRTRYVDVNGRDHAGYTSLHEAVICGSVPLARCLLKHGASVHIASRLDGVRPLHDAIERDDMEMVRLLLSWGADPTISTYSSRTGLNAARTRRMKDFLADYMADVKGFAQPPRQAQPWCLPLYPVPPGPVARRRSASATDVDSSAAEDDVAEGEGEDNGMNVLADLPPDPDEQDKDLGLFFEMSDEPMIQTYSLAVTPSAIRKSYVTLSDLLEYLALTREGFRRMFPGVPCVQIPMDRLRRQLLNAVMSDAERDLVMATTCRPRHSQPHGGAAGLAEAEEATVELVEYTATLATDVLEYERIPLSLDSSLDPLDDSADVGSQGTVAYEELDERDIIGNDDEGLLDVLDNVGADDPEDFSRDELPQFPPSPGKGDPGYMGSSPWSHVGLTGMVDPEGSFLPHPRDPYHAPEAPGMYPPPPQYPESSYFSNFRGLDSMPPAEARRGWGFPAESLKSPRTLHNGIPTSRYREIRPARGPGTPSAIMTLTPRAGDEEPMQCRAGSTPIPAPGSSAPPPPPVILILPDSDEYAASLANGNIPILTSGSDGHPRPVLLQTVASQPDALLGSNTRTAAGTRTTFSTRTTSSTRKIPRTRTASSTRTPSNTRTPSSTRTLSAPSSALVLPLAGAGQTDSLLYADPSCGGTRLAALPLPAAAAEGGTATCPVEPKSLPNYSALIERLASKTQQSLMKNHPEAPPPGREPN